MSFGVGVELLGEEPLTVLLQFTTSNGRKD